MTIEQIKQPIINEYSQFQEYFHRYTDTRVELLDQVIEYLGQFPGKQLRPIMVLLAAKACGHYEHRHALLATAVEMLHNATLMHDDVIDESDSRRNHDSVCHRWSNQVAVLSGDFFLAQVMAIVQEVGDSTISNLLSHTVSVMCQGELQQLASIHNNISEESYIDIIGAKTASFLATCCEFGASTFDGSEAPYSKALRDFGYHYGVVFQIRDDINDFNSEHDVALPAGASAESLINKHTQLAIEALAPLPPSEAKEVLLAMLHPSAPQPVC